MSDGWSKYGTHYFGLFATYNKKIKHIVDGVITESTIPKLVLLAMSLMKTLFDDNNDDEPTEATNFKAEIHAQFNSTTFLFLLEQILMIDQRQRLLIIAV